jgi:hypothetical protein
MAQIPWNKGLKGFNRPMRQSRYRDLLSLGFLGFEAREFSVMPRSIPYLKEMAAESYTEKKRWIRAGKTEAEWITHIRRRYPMKDWGRAGDKGAAWAMLRDTEKPWKERHPDYVRGYPKKSHHRDGEKTRSKLNGSFEDNIKNMPNPLPALRMELYRLEQTNPKNEYVLSKIQELKLLIERMANKGE